MCTNAVGLALAIVAGTSVAWCRSLTDGETRFLSAYFWLDRGATRRVDLASVRIACLAPAGSHAVSDALQPLGPKAKLWARGDVKAKGSDGDDEDLLGDADAITIGNTIHFKGRFCMSDLAPGYPANPKPIEQSLLAHEVMHVWQGQNVTGYSIMRIIAEHVQYGDAVYRYEPVGTNMSFLSYRLEQQARIMQDYAYWKLKGDLRYKKLEPLLRQAFEVAGKNAGK